MTCEPIIFERKLKEEVKEGKTNLKYLFYECSSPWITFLI